MMKVVLPIAAILAILIAAGAPVPLTQEFPVDLQGAQAQAAEPYPVAFDPYTGWGVADLQAAATEPPVVRSGAAPAAFADLRTLPFVEVDPFDRYAVESPFPGQPGRTTGNPWEGSLVTLVTFADLRARYDEDAAPASDPWWGDALPPLDAK